MTITLVVPSCAAYRFISHARPAGFTGTLWQKPLFKAVFVPASVTGASIGPRTPTDRSNGCQFFSPPRSRANDLGRKGQTSFLVPQASPLPVLTRQLFEKTELNRSVTRDKTTSTAIRNGVCRSRLR